MAVLKLRYSAGANPTGGGGGGSFPLARSATVTGNDIGPNTGYIAPKGFCDDSGLNRQLSRIYPVTTIGRYWLRLEEVLGEGSKSVTVSTFASTNTVSGTHFTAVVSQGISYSSAEIGDKGVAIDILAIPTGFGLVGITISGANAFRATCWIWLKGTGYVPGANFMITSNGTNVNGNTAGAGTSGSPWQSMTHALSQMGNTGGVLYVQKNGTHVEWGGTAGSGSGIQISNACSNTAPLIVLPDPANSGTVLFDQGSTLGGANITFSNAVGPDFTGTPSSVWLCGFHFYRGKITFVNTTNPAVDCVVWQCEIDNYSTSASNGSGIAFDRTRRFIAQDYYVHHIYATEAGSNLTNPFTAVPSGTESGCQAFGGGANSVVDASFVHGLHDAVQYGVQLKDNGVSQTGTALDVIGGMFRRFGKTSGGESGPIAWPVQSGPANNGVVRYCAGNRSTETSASGSFFACEGSGTAQFSNLDLKYCTNISGGGLFGGAMNGVRVLDCISQDATAEEITLNSPQSTNVTQLQRANNNLYIRSTHGWRYNYAAGTVTLSTLANWQAVAANAFLATSPDPNSTTTSTTPGYQNVSLEQFQYTNTLGRGGFPLGVGAEPVGIRNNFLNTDLTIN